MDLASDAVIRHWAAHGARPGQRVFGVVLHIPVSPELHALVADLVSACSEIRHLHFHPSDLTLDGDLKTDDFGPGRGQADRAGRPIPYGILPAETLDSLFLEHFSRGGVDLGKLRERVDLCYTERPGLPVLWLKAVSGKRRHRKLRARSP